MVEPMLNGSRSSSRRHCKRRRFPRRRRSRLGEGLVRLSRGGFEQLETRVLLAVDITALSPVVNGHTNSTAKEQSMVWQHDSQWWSVIRTESNTLACRLDGSTWTQVIVLDNSSDRADVKPIGNGDITYVLLDKGTSSKLAKLSFSNNTYQLVPLVSPSTP